MPDDQGSALQLPPHIADRVRLISEPANWVGAVTIDAEAARYGGIALMGTIGILWLLRTVRSGTSAHRRAEVKAILRNTFGATEVAPCVRARTSSYLFRAASSNPLNSDWNSPVSTKFSGCH